MSQERDIHVIKNIMVGWCVITTLLLLWSFASYLWERKKKALEDATEETTYSGSASSSSTQPKVVANATVIGL